MLFRHIVKQSLLLKNAGAASSRVAAYHVGHHEHSTMNDMPVPSGDWNEASSRKNSKYNAVLLTGILFLAGTIGFAKQTGLVHLNYSAPASLD